MPAPRPFPTTEAPTALCLGINILLVVGVLAMHHLFLGTGEGVGSHHGRSSVSSEVAHAEPAATLSVGSTMSGAPDGGDTDPLSDCGGLMALCFAMILGISAYIVLRKRLVDRVLWQLPPPTEHVRVVVIAPFERRSPLQRSSVLRC